MNYILALDPGFRSVGFAVLAIATNDVSLVKAGVIRTESSAKKRRVLATEDNMRRAREIYLEIDELTNPRSGAYEVKALCAEAMSFPRNASAAAKVAICWGVIASIVEIQSLPLIQASPQEVKKYVTGKKDASKEEVEAAVCRLLPEASTVISLPKTLKEHAYDAVAVGLTCLNSDIGRTIKNLVTT